MRRLLLLPPALVAACILAPILCLAAPATIYTTVHSHPQELQGKNTDGDPARWSVGGHVRAERLPHPAAPEPPEYWAVVFSTHLNTVCYSQSSLTHKANMQITCLAGAGTNQDFQRIQLWMNQKVWLNAQVDQAAAPEGELVTLEYDGQVRDFPWDPTSVQPLDESDQVRYGVGTWQGDRGADETSAITPAI